MENTQVLALQEQERLFTEQLAQLKAAPTLDIDTYNAINAELQTVHGKIEGLQAKDQEVQTAVATAQSDILENLAGFTFNGEAFSIYQFTETIEGADILITYIQQKIGEVTAGAISYKQELEATQLKLEDAETDKARITAANDQLELDNADLQAKREAAAQEIAELQSENKRIAQELKELRENVVVKSSNNTNLNGNAGQSIADWKAARPYIYNLRWKDEYKKTIYLANYALNGEELEFSHLAKGKYNIVSEEEAHRFRETAEQTQPATESAEPVQEAPVPDSPLVEPPAVQFPSNEALPAETHDTVPSDSTNGEVVEEAETVSRAEFNELKARVTAIEKNTDVVAMFG